MAQDLTVNIKTTSDVPQAMDKAKSATVSFGKQVEDIQKKFSTAFKDIALSFVAPLVLLNTAINYIGAAIEKRKQDIKEAFDFAVKAESKYLDSTTVYLARKQAAEEQDAKEREMAKTSREETTRKELAKPGMRDRVAEEIGGFRGFRLKFGLDANSAEAMSKDADVQAVISRIVAPAVEASKKAAEAAAAPKQVDFKGPDGISNVIGVGASPGMVILNEQLRIQQQIADDLRAMAASRAEAANIDFTKYYGRPDYSVPAYPKFK
jgi:hypothetical protein